MEEFLKQVTIEYLRNTPIGDNFNKAISILESVLERVQILKEKDESIDQTVLKAGTALLFAFINKASHGIMPESFTEDDWKDIFQSVDKYAIKMDCSAYSEFIILKYADFIELSAELLSDYVEPDKLSKILALSDKLKDNADNFEKGNITETELIEDSLYTALDAMMKLLSAAAGSYLCTEFADLLDAVTEFSFAYIRLTLYKTERDLLKQYVEGQYQLDDELKKELDAYLNSLTSESEKFNQLIEDAFSPEFETSLNASYALAKAAGVDESELLKTVEAVDEFFM